MKKLDPAKFHQVGLTTEHFELMFYPSGHLTQKLYIREKAKPRLLVWVSGLISEAEKAMVKFERLYPCHFLAKEWQAREKIILRKPRK